MKTIFNKRDKAGMLGVTAACFLAACTTSPTIDTSDPSAMTYDGLYPVAGGTADDAWARPDVDWSQYDEILLEAVGIEYRPGGESSRLAYSRSSDGPFEVTDEQKARLQSTVWEAFREELARSERFRLVDEPGPATLLIRAGLLDVVSWVPPDNLGPRDSVYLSRVGEATLVLEIRDSVTNAIYARAVDRRAAETLGEFRESNRVNNASEVRRLANSWARSLRTRLEEAVAPRD